MSVYFYFGTTHPYTYGGRVYVSFYLLTYDKWVELRIDYLS